MEMAEERKEDRPGIHTTSEAGETVITYRQVERSSGPPCQEAESTNDAPQKVPDTELGKVDIIESIQDRCIATMVPNGAFSSLFRWIMCSAKSWGARTVKW